MFKILLTLAVLFSCAKDGDKSGDRTNTIPSSETCKIETKQTEPTVDSPEVVTIESEPTQVVITEKVEVCSTTTEEFEISSISDSELLEEFNRRGLDDNAEQEDSSNDNPATLAYSSTVCNNLPVVDITIKEKHKSYFIVYQNQLYQVTNKWSTIWETYSLETGKLVSECRVKLKRKGQIDVKFP